MPLGLPVSRGGREFQKTIARITDEVRLSTKGAARSKEKIAGDTANAAQEMHRISTGAKLEWCEKNSSFVSCFCVSESFSGMNSAGQPGEFVDSKRIVAQEQAACFHEDGIGHHASRVSGVGPVAGNPVIGVIEVHQQVTES